MSFRMYPAGKDMFKVNNRKTGTRCEICSKLTIKTSKRRCKKYRVGYKTIACSFNKNTSQQLLFKDYTGILRF